MTDVPLAADVRRSRTAFIRVGVIAPFALLALAAVVVLAWLPELPDPIATHWGTDGVDGFLPRATFLPVLLAVCGGMLLFDVLLAVVSPRMPQSSAKPPVRAWSATSKLLGAMNLGLGAGFALLLLSTAGIQRGLADAADAPDIGGWAALAVPALTATMLVFRVRVDQRGLRVRSLIPWPRTRIPLDDIDDVATVTIDPLREFGGWGWRIAVDGRRGVVLRAGEALQVTRANGRVFIITVDGAAEAAAALETVRLRSKDDRS
ncbi:DUF1648 domain-containing protein [Microbacterium sp. YMB-B2]|uniref:DUF1648 domain-containing protein n=1 Tax=Microbacterium tenebrionis TaxID=2830665 RepID=A0A9X1S154_9MICO|nr:DUF1648 domain-containing protein [Microbacterium tenebrionis]MCC2029503.1 DUF1648 domain-containing protein [Microbacterium tenebrionis]